MKKRGLGRGLDVLLSQTKISEKVDNTKQQGVLEVPIELLTQGVYQPRKRFAKEALEALASSIKSQGIIQPLVVREVNNVNGKKYEILAGERRWRAAQLAELANVPVIVQNVSDQEALALGIIENIQREDLNVVEEAEALQRLIKEFGITHQEIADLIGRSRSSISNTLRLLELDSQVQTMLSDGEIDMGHARAILSLSKAEQLDVALKIVMNGWTVRDVEAYVKNLNEAPVQKNKEPKKVDPDVVRLTTDLSEYFGVKVDLKTKKAGKGQIQINYDSLDQLEGILNKINQK